MKRMQRYSVRLGATSLQYTYVLAVSSLCFTLWLRIDELVQLKWDDIRIGGVNEQRVPYIEVTIKGRKFERNTEGQIYAIHEQKNEFCNRAYTHLRAWVEKYNSLLSRPLQRGDPLFPHADDLVSQISFDSKMNQQNFMKTINAWVEWCCIIPKNAAGEELGKFTMHCFRRGGTQYRFLTGTRRWPLHVVKWWGGWGCGDDVNTIIR